MGNLKDMMDSSTELCMVLPRVLIVSRRCVRKNKFVDFVGEYHLDLIVNYGAVPVIVPRVAGIHMLLESFEPIHGVLLCEGEDVDPSLYESDLDGLTPQEIEEIKRLHSSDTSIDKEKDCIELQLAKLCLQRNIPFMGICRGSQILNVACGGTLYQDVEKELSRNGKERVRHMDYDNYDGHRHTVKIMERTPLEAWFKDSLRENMELMVNSYHHQGVKRLSERFVPMAFAPDGLVEAFYDPNAYNLEEGKFIMGLQFHPERMRHEENGNPESAFDYPGCPSAYQEFVKAVIAYQKKVNGEMILQLDGEMEKKRKVIVRSFSVAKNMYTAGARKSFDNKDIEAGAHFLESSAAFSTQQEKRLKQMGATVRNASSYMQRLQMNEGRETAARKMMAKMSIEQLSDLLSFYHVVGHICSEVLEKKLMEP